MPALVTLDRAKAHLQVRIDDDDELIAAQVEEASAIILRYLKSRANNVGSVSSSSVASPTVITMSAAHTFINGDTVTIAGHTDSSPDLNGEHVISGVTATTFTVPVAVTVAGTGGTATVLWDDRTVPFDVRSGVLLMLSHLYEHRGDTMEADEALWSAIRRLLERNRDPAFV